MFNNKRASKIKNDKIARWRLELSCYSDDLIYGPGSDNKSADALSRVCTEWKVLYTTIVDEYSRYPFAYACSNVTSEMVIKCFCDLISMFGLPSYVHRDRGAQFMSEELRSFLHSKGIATSKTSIYNPRGNGQLKNTMISSGAVFNYGFAQKNCNHLYEKQLYPMFYMQ